MDRRVVDHWEARGAGGLGDIGGGELVHRRFGLRNMHVRTGSGVLTADERRQRGDRREPGRDMVGEDSGGVVEAATRGGCGVFGGPQPGDPCGGPHEWAVAHARAPWAGGPECAALGEYDVWVELPQLFVGKPQ